jgi:hypothetical protein
MIYWKKHGDRIIIYERTDRKNPRESRIDV